MVGDGSVFGLIVQCYEINKHKILYLHHIKSNDSETTTLAFVLGCYLKPYLALAATKVCPNNRVGKQLPLQFCKVIGQRLVLL